MPKEWKCGRCFAWLPERVGAHDHTHPEAPYVRVRPDPPGTTALNAPESFEVRRAYRYVRQSSDPVRDIPNTIEQ